jgi:HlyD family secretion protein
MVTVPASAVRDGAVFVVVDGKAIRKTVKVAGTTSLGVQVAEGLIGGEDIISSPPDNLKDGQKVRPKQG